MLLRLRSRLAQLSLTRCDQCGTLIDAPGAPAGVLCGSADCLEAARLEFALGL